MQLGMATMLVPRAIFFKECRGTADETC